MALTDVQIRRAGVRLEPYKLYDSQGLYLIVTPQGGKWWRWKYRWGGREKLLSLGTYPTTGLKEAREKRDQARRTLASGIDPGQERRAAKRAQADSFKALALEWMTKAGDGFSARTRETYQTVLEQYAFPDLGPRPITSITAADALDCAERAEKRGGPWQARRLVQLIGQVFRYAIATRRAASNPAADLRGAIRQVKPRHRASVKGGAGIGALLLALEGYAGTLIIRAALELAPLVFVRPVELRFAEWAEFDLGRAEWRIPAERMKMGREHIVPLSTQALAILRELHALTGAGRYVFPHRSSAAKPIGQSTIIHALRRLGYSKDEMTGHGFRSMASTILNECGLWHQDAIEIQLAHGPRDKVRASYNFAQRLPERRRMMQWWADHLDGLKEAARAAQQA